MRSDPNASPEKTITSYLLNKARTKNQEGMILFSSSNAERISKNIGILGNSDESDQVVAALESIAAEMNPNQI